MRIVLLLCCGIFSVSFCNCFIVKNLCRRLQHGSHLFCNGAVDNHNDRSIIKQPEGESAQKNRRIRYSGKYPKRFELKYKEERGDVEVISRVISKGGTPAGQHVAIMLHECLEHLNISNARELNATISVDCTTGFGGHSTAILKKILPSGGQHFALDQDGIELNKTEIRIRQFLENNISDPAKLKRAQSSVHFIHGNFRNIESILESQNLLGKVDCLLADLGFSSMQIDNPDRGFTYKFDGPLDMRMDPSSTLTAADYLAIVDENELASALRENSDEEFADDIATAVKKHPIPRTTLQLADRVRGVYTARRRPRIDIAGAVARTMQAVRIAVNAEFEALEALLAAIPRVLAPGGRAVLLTFHSGEDRRVKSAFKGGAFDGLYSAWGREVVRPDMDEQRANPRSKCAKLRWATRSLSPLRPRDDNDDSTPL